MPNFFFDETTEDHIRDERMRLRRHIRERLEALRVPVQAPPPELAPTLEDGR